MSLNTVALQAASFIALKETIAHLDFNPAVELLMKSGVPKDDATVTVMTLTMIGNPKKFLTNCQSMFGTLKNVVQKIKNKSFKSIPKSTLESAGSGSGSQASGVSQNLGSGGRRAGVDSNNQSNFIKGLTQRAELALQEVNLLDKNGKLTQHALDNSKKILDGPLLENKAVIDRLSKSGSLDNWGKYSTTVKGKFSVDKSISGKKDNPITNQKTKNIEIHFYAREQQGKIVEVCYDIDFKVKGPIDIFPNNLPKGDPWPKPKKF